MYHRHSRYWSALACTQAPGIESGASQGPRSRPSTAAIPRNSSSEAENASDTVLGEGPRSTVLGEGPRSTVLGEEPRPPVPEDSNAALPAPSLGQQDQYVFVPEQPRTQGVVGVDEETAGNLFDVLELLDL